MIGSGMPRRDRAIVSVVVVVLLYGLAALLWFSGRQQAWTKAEKGYALALRQLESENGLIAKRASWQGRADAEGLKMPVAEEGESTQTRWQRMLEKIAGEHFVRIVSEQPKPEEEHGGVWEMPIEVKYEASLKRLVEFLYALNTAEGAMFDVRDIDISAKSSGLLSGKFTLTCAYLKGGDTAVHGKK